MIRAETRARARALQLLYAWELLGGTGDPHQLASGVARVARVAGAEIDEAEELARRVIDRVGALDARATAAADNWRLARIATVERNILRLGILELQDPAVPPKVAIDEAVRLARWFAGPRAPAFVNGVLDRVARDLRRL